jgi:hypothetical protein
MRSDGIVGSNDPNRAQTVIPAQAGTQYSEAISDIYWIPACTGTTTTRMALVDRT